jgi:hypothetical protein
MSYLRISKSRVTFLLVMLSILISAGSSALRAQTGNSGTIAGMVKDPSGAAIPDADVTIANPVSGYQREMKTDATGQFRFPNIPFNPYHLTATATGFTPYTQDVDVNSTVVTSLEIGLKIGAASTNVTVTENASDLLEISPTEHTDVDRSLIEDLPIESASSSVSSLVTLATPGIAADSNGLFHGLGDHASNSFSIDGQPITDQQSKVFSNQIPEDAIQSLEVIDGAPPAEYGDKTSVVIDVTTRSGLGIKQPTGGVNFSYGSFGSENLGFNLATGGDKWGNFVSASGLNTDRFLDPPEPVIFHDNGNEENFFDRVDYHFSQADSAQLNFQYTRSWFQTPNSYDSQYALPWSALDGGGAPIGPNGQLVGPADQRSQIGTFDVAPSWTHVINTHTVFTLGAFYRQDQYDYYPSSDPFADLGPTNLQRQSIAQSRNLTNAGIRADASYVRGINNIKVGISYEQTLLHETDTLGIIDPTFNAPCVTAGGNPVAGFNSPSQCVGGGFLPNTAANPVAGTVVPTFIPQLGCYDLTRATPAAADGCAGTAPTSYIYDVHAPIKQVAFFAQDQLTLGNWTLNLGVREDFYNGISTANQTEPRGGLAYKVGPTNTVLRISYGHMMETPFNENLILASLGCNDRVINEIMTVTLTTPGSPYTCLTAPLSPSIRNEYHAGFEQAFGKYFVLDAEYIWKYTHLAYDFSVLGNTPITFPIEWQKSKIPGYTLRGSVPNFHGFTAYVVAAHVAARFFNPQVSGIGSVPAGPIGSVFRIDHDENFEETTHAQYQPWKRGPWFGFTWRYDSGLVAGSVPFPDPANPTAPVDLTGLSADEQMEAGLYCGNQKPTLATPLTTCLPSQYGSTLVKIPGTPGDPKPENDDHNPPRIDPRHLFDAAVGDDDLFHGDRYKWSLRFTVVNLTNKLALYNFLSTFSGTHYVQPRSETIELGFHF